jgi:superoxide dismutase, Cu-Zn family
MKFWKLLAISLLLVVVVTFLPHGMPPAVSADVKARATIEGAPGSGIFGEVKFKEKENRNRPTKEVEIEAKIEGLPPNTIRGFHIHEVGFCNPSDSFTSAGGHFDPGPNGNSNPDANHPYHLGDIPNLESDDKGKAELKKYVTSRVTLSSGPLTLFDSNGSAVIVHLNEDQGTTGVSGGSGGPRIACGVIVND